MSWCNGGYKALEPFLIYKSDSDFDIDNSASVGSWINFTSIAFPRDLICKNISAETFVESDNTNTSSKGYYIGVNSGDRIFSTVVSNTSNDKLQLTSKTHMLADKSSISMNSVSSNTGSSYTSTSLQGGGYIDIDVFCIDTVASTLTFKDIEIWG